MTASASLDKQVQHFLDVSKRDLQAAGDALLHSGLQAFERVAEHVSNAKITQHITHLVSSSAAAFDAFIAKIGNPQFWAFMKGAVGASMGGGILAEAAAVAAWLGVSILTAKVIGIALILYGLYTVLPVVWERVTAGLPIAPASS